MHVQISYRDNSSYTVEEVVHQAVSIYGKNVQVKVSPESFAAHDMIYFALQQMLTHEQLSCLFDKKSDYQSEIAKIRSSALYKVEEILNQVLIDNEAKIG